MIVGATSGIGRATAGRFADEGATLVLAGRRAGLLQEVGEGIAARTGRRAAGVPLDAADRDQVRALVEFTRAAFGRIDVLVYAAGTNLPERAIRVLAPESWSELLATNLTGAYHCTQLVLPLMREQSEGLIVYISSISALRPDVSGVAYQASKHGMVGLAAGVMEEERQNGIRTSVIYPGLVDTPLIDRRPVPPPPEVRAQALRPEDVAEAALFVASLPARAHVPDLVIQPSRL